jgi:hypothetical protein
MDKRVCSKVLNIKPLPTGKSVVISYLISLIACLNFQIFDSNFAYAFASFFGYLIPSTFAFASLIKIGFIPAYQGHFGEKISAMSIWKLVHA